METTSRSRPARSPAPRPWARWTRPYRNVLDAVGGTPLIELTGFLQTSRIQLFLKFEAANPGGSAKDRPAALMIEAAVRSRQLEAGSVVVESSSGNMGVGLAQACAWYGLRFICVVDAGARPGAIQAMRALGAEVDVVEPHGTGGRSPLEERLERVAFLVSTIEGAFWPNQYANEMNPAAHAGGTMAEIDAALDGDVTGVFVGVGTTGTLGGCLDFVSANARHTGVTAVDAVGSILFGGEAGKRCIPGMGAARVPPLAIRRWGGEGAHPRILRVTDLDCVVGCRRLARTDALLVGGSAGGVLQAIRQVHGDLPEGRYVAIAADAGHRYLDTVYDDRWVHEELGCGPERLARLVGRAATVRL